MINRCIDDNFEAGFYKCFYDNGVFAPTEGYLVKSAVDRWESIRITYQGGKSISKVIVWKSDYEKFRVLKYYEGITSFQELQELHPEEFI